MNTTDPVYIAAGKPYLDQVDALALAQIYVHTDGSISCVQLGEPPFRSSPVFTEFQVAVYPNNVPSNGNG